MRTLDTGRLLLHNRSMNTSACLQENLPCEALCSFPDCQIVRQKDRFIQQKDSIINNLTAENERLKALLNKRESALFGRSSEKQQAPQAEQPTDDAGVHVIKRGARFGHKGHGRKIPNLPEVVVTHEIPDNEMYCPICGKPRDLTGIEEVSYEVDYEVRPVLKKHVRRKAISTCDCPGKKSVTACKPPQVIPKGKFSNSFLAHILVMKFLFQIPLHRQAMIMRMQGLKVSDGSLTGMLKKLEPFILPLYLLLAEASRNENHWHVDETGWMHFVEVPDKQGWRWWLWVFVSPLTIFFILDPSRSSDVPRKHFGEKARGIISCDRFSAYGKLVALIEGLTRALCWSHFRRDFVDAGKSLTCLKPWADLWVARIAGIYRLNQQRLAVLDRPELFNTAQDALENALQSMLQSIRSELSDHGLHWQQEKVLTSAVKHWEGLTVFVDNPQIPLDNNMAERCLRPGALGRKSYYGTHSDWSGRLLAASMSVLQTAAKHELNAEAYLRYYLDGCAKAGGTPPDLERFLPWNIPDEIIEKYDMRTGREHPG